MLFLLLKSSVPACAQSTASPFDGYTPGQAMSSSPFGAVALSGMEAINPASGMLSVNIPLLTIKGRGSTSVPVLVRLGSNVWDTIVSKYQYNCTQSGCQTGYGYVVNTTGWNPLGLNFGQSKMVFRAAGDYCSGNSYNSTLTRATFTAPDGTETEFIDQKTNGAAEPPGYNRGTVFIADDGSYAKFTSSSSISDTTGCAAQTIAANGTLILRDGTNYTISNGTATQIRDRNGNLTNISSAIITDSLNRVYTVTVNGSQSQIQYAGTGGAPRTITVKYDSLDHNLASGESLETYGQLWPQLPSSTQASNLNQYCDPNIVSEIDLADGSKYTFTYHSYGDVAQITLPTGGAIQYDYGSSAQSVSASPAAMYVLTRLLSERREVLNGAVTSRTVFPANEIDRYDGAGNLLAKETYTIDSTGTMPSSANNYNAWNYNQKTTVNYYDKDGTTVLESQTISYVQNNCKVNCSTVQTVTTSRNGMVKKSVYSYDQYNNLTEQKDNDWGSGSPGGVLRDTQITPFTSNSGYTSANILNLPLAIKVYDGSNNLYSFTQYSYDEYSNPATPLYNCPNIIGHDNANFGGSGARGNPTTIGQQIVSSGAWLNTYNSYDIAGNLVNVADPNGHNTAFSYNDNFPDGNRNSYAFATVVTNALGQKPFQAQYDYSIGQPLSTTDANGNKTSYAYADPLDRVTQIVQPTGAQTKISYQTPYWTIVYQDQKTPGDQALQKQVVYDGLGHPIEQRTLEGGSTTTLIAVDSAYDALGRVKWTANPTRVNIPDWSTDGLGYMTVYTYDGLGRIKTVQTPDGANTATSYSGNQSTVTDPAGHARKMTSDALGRITAVVEDATGANLTTQYSYDAMGNLTAVQKCAASGCPSGQSRSFAYNSLGRLTDSTNPESGHVSYTYDNNGNLQTRTDARNIKTTYTYDALNRLTGKTYADGVTSNVTYNWDPAIPNGIGRLGLVANGSGIRNYTGYDALGHVTQSNQQTPSYYYNFSYTYDLSGALTSETYPSGRVLSTAYDGAARPTGVSGTLSGVQTNYVSPFPNALEYWPHGAPNIYLYANNVVPVNTFTKLLQSYETYATVGNNPNDWLLYIGKTYHNDGTLGYANEGYGPAVTWGNMTWRNTTFGYDALERLTSAQDSGWIRNFSYDEFGNMAVAPNGNYNVPWNNLTPYNNGSYNPYNPANNRLLEANYDSAGNIIGVGALTFSYDAEGRQTQSKDTGSSTVVNYSYDGEGNRVQKSITGGATTVYIYDAFGKLAAEYSSVGITPACTTCYLSYDHLGSVRLITDQSGSVISRHDYLPFGEEIPNGSGGRSGNQFGAASNVNQMFTGQQRDPEMNPNVDYFNARSFMGVLGNFTSPDPANAGADITNPQSWNAYSYVLGNPLANVDPSGMHWEAGPPNVHCFYTASSFNNSWTQAFQGCDVEYTMVWVPDPNGPSEPPGGGGSNPSQPQQPAKTATRPTFNACMAAHANDFSILGTINAGTNALFNRQDTYKNNILLGALGGNSITSLLYGLTADAAGTGVTLAPTIVTAAMGTVTSYGRRTSTIMALNIAGKGGVPLALGASSAGAKAALTTAGKWLGLGLEFEVKLGVDAAAAAAEAAYCYSQTQ